MASKKDITALATGHTTSIVARYKKGFIKSIEPINTPDKEFDLLADFVGLPSWKYCATSEVAKWLWDVLVQARQKRRRLLPSFIRYYGKVGKKSIKEIDCKK
jgi:hypothetical protein